MKSKDLTGMIFDIRRFSVHDGPGIRTTVFLKGCLLRCLWCHNPESFSMIPTLFYYKNRCLACGRCVSACVKSAIRTIGEIDWGKCARCGKCAADCPSKALVLVGKKMTISEVLNTVSRDMPFYRTSGGGMTVSGGEPLFQPDFTLLLMKAARRKDINVALDTSGYCESGLFKKMLGYADLLLFDLKCADQALHKKLTGVSNRPIIENLRIAAKSKKVQLIIRIPVIPGMNDSRAEIIRMRKILNSMKRLFTVDLLPYNELAGSKYGFGDLPRYRFKYIKKPTDGKMAEIKKVFSGYRVLVGGSG